MAGDGTGVKLETAGDLERFIGALSRHDRAVLHGVVRRISEIEATKGVQAAETAARQVLEILSVSRTRT
jgi:hypothetical protein